MEIRTGSADETVEAGEKLGRLLERGDVVCLTGDLGAGKTAFTGGIAHALGVQGYITSPTFTIVNEYSGREKLYHFDVYRIEEPEEMYEIGFEEYLSGEGIVIIEWADRVNELLPSERIGVEIKKDVEAGPDFRIIKVGFTGEKYGWTRMRLAEMLGGERER